MITQLFKKTSAFTLVELLITIAVLGTVVGVGTASYVSFNERQIVEQAALSLKNNLRAIQQRALSGQKDIAICRQGVGGAPIPLKGWCFSPQEGSTPGEVDEYILYGTCGPDPSASNEIKSFPETPDAAERVAMPDRVTITNYVEEPVGSGSYESFSGKILFEAGRSNVTIAGPDPLALPYDEIIYCLVSDLPGLTVTGADNVYKMRVRSSGEIIDDGFVKNADCPA